jgi:hypothetical protein
MRSMEGIKDFRVGTRLKTLLLGAGFTEVDAKMIPLPLSAWPDSKVALFWSMCLPQDCIDHEADPTSRCIGTMNRGNITRLLASLSLYPLTQRLHMPPAQYQDLISRAQEEVGDRSLKAYFPL